MKTAEVKKQRIRSYPNAARPQYYIDKLVNGVLMVAISLGLVTALAFLLTL